MDSKRMLKGVDSLKLSQKQCKQRVRRATKPFLSSYPDVLIGGYGVKREVKLKFGAGLEGYKREKKG